MTVETSSTTNSSRASLKRRVAYTAAAGAAACVAGNSADAAVVYSGVQDIAIGSGFSQNLDLNLDAQGDIRLKNYVYLSPYQGATVNFFPGKIAGFTNSGRNYVTALAAGSPIDSTTVNPTFNGRLAYGAVNPVAQFNNANHAFLGLSFPAGANLYYGWVRVTINNAAGTFVINDWAYNDVSGSPINAGDGTVPEPGTLGLLAAGALGVAALRRKRAS